MNKILEILEVANKILETLVTKESLEKFDIDGTPEEYAKEYNFSLKSIDKVLKLIKSGKLMRGGSPHFEMSYKNGKYVTISDKENLDVKNDSDAKALLMNFAGDNGDPIHYFK